MDDGLIGKMLGCVAFLFMSYLWGWVIWGRIFQKAGYTRSKGWTMCIPVANLAIFIVFAYSDWPVRRQLREAVPDADNLLPEMSREFS